MAIIALENGGRRAMAVDDIAAAQGIFPGQSLADALALVPHLKIVEADLAEDRAALARLADWCDRFSPGVALDQPDGLLLDVSGCAHLWGGETCMAEALLQRLTEQDIPAQIAIAGTFGAAWALARYAPDRITIAAPGKDRAHLIDLPVAALRLEEGLVHQLKRLGLSKVRQATALPRIALRKRFGDVLMRQIAFAFGTKEEALDFRQPVSPWRERRVFAEPVAKLEDLHKLLEEMAGALCRRLERTGLGARWFELALHRLDGDVALRAVGTALPARDAKRLCDLFAPKLETIDPGFGIEVATFSAETVLPLRPEQAHLLVDEAEISRMELAPLIDRLRNRFGHDRVWQVTPYPSHLPERSVTRVEPLSLRDDVAWPDEHDGMPIRLLRWAAPLEHVVAALPDDPPGRFHWRGLPHRVRKAEGPERIAAEWWRRPWDENAPDRIRDYYQVEDDSGARFWVFRTGLHGGAREVQWWLHGLFA